MTPTTLPFPVEHKRALWRAVQHVIVEASDTSSRPTVTPYFDMAGELLFARVRIDTDGGKLIRPFYLDGADWTPLKGRLVILWLVYDEPCQKWLTDPLLLLILENAGAEVREDLRRAIYGRIGAIAGKYSADKMPVGTDLFEIRQLVKQAELIADADRRALV